MAAAVASIHEEAAKKLLPKLAGLAAGGSTVERLAEDVGGLLGDELEAGSAYGQDPPSSPGAGTATTPSA
ncbi:MAG: hypothetical protein K2W96_02680 [Gemmataceae bacterium]|nr:hypothetical protein [Gemmataceae bacterium]